MSRHAIRIAAGAIAALGLLTACSSGENPGAAQQSAPASSSANSSAEPSTGGGANPSLKVSDPLPTQKLVGDPCTALGESDAASVGLAMPGRPMQLSGLSGCQWISSQFAQNAVGIIPVTLNKNGLSDIYAQKAEQAYFEPFSIDGYPAAFASKSDDRGHGTCNLYVGVTDQLAVGVSAGIGTGKYRTAPCDAAKLVATAMVNHLKSAS